MNSIPLEKLASIVIAATVESRRPWRVEQLWLTARRSTVRYPDSAATSGLSSEQASELVRGRIYEQVLKAGGMMDALPPGQSKPTPEQIDTALDAFGIEQWIGLIDSLDQVSVQALAIPHTTRYGRTETEARRKEGRAHRGPRHHARHRPLA
jgi:hypothetical protein